MSNAVHPRGRGEQCRSKRKLDWQGGSSPRARGTVMQLTTGSTVTRFIPAGAGNRGLTRMPRHIAPVHPRGRGEQSPPLWRCTTGSGSSPRARGTVQICFVTHCLLRFIPAGAGNRRPFLAIACLIAVHPRGRGEQCRLLQIVIFECGSSPRARGTGHGDSLVSDRDRFIPAGAGNRAAYGPAPAWTTVHPRGREEQDSAATKTTRKTGSSPRARGTDLQGDLGVAGQRFIPAGAGNSLASGASGWAMTVHPRGRGEQRNLP